MQQMTEKEVLIVVKSACSSQWIWICFKGLQPDEHDVHKRTHALSCLSLVICRRTAAVKAVLIWRWNHTRGRARKYYSKMQALVAPLFQSYMFFFIWNIAVYSCHIGNTGDSEIFVYIFVGETVQWSKRRSSLSWRTDGSPRLWSLR